MRYLIPPLLFLAGCTSEKAGDDRPSASRDELLDPERCKNCHADQFREWSGSMHAYAAEDPVFVAMNQRGQRETKGKLGTFCVNCHAPLAVREGKTKDGLNLAGIPKKYRGVTCFFCHSVDRIDGSHNNPLHLANDGIMRGSISDPAPSSPHKSAYSEFQDRDRSASSKLCGACHDVTNNHGTAIERTYAEWQSSVYSHPGGATCSQCHMEQSKSLHPVANVSGAPARRSHGHLFAGVDVALTPQFPEQTTALSKVKDLLNTTLQSALCVKVTGSTSAIRVLVDNVAAGHAWPSGASQDRRVWFEVRASRNNVVLYESGIIPDGVSPTTSADLDAWMLRDCLFNEAGKEVHMFWEASRYQSHVLPAPLTFNTFDPRFYQTHVFQSFPRRSGSFEGTPDKVQLRIRIQPIGLDVLDDLIATGDLSPSIRSRMPTFDVGSPLEWTDATATEEFLEERIPVRCVTSTNFNVKADKVESKTRGMCEP